MNNGNGKCGDKDERVLCNVMENRERKKLKYDGVRYAFQKKNE